MYLYHNSYEVSWLAEFFHSFPHVDLTFETVNSTFDPDNTRYNEVLLFWAAIPVLWLLLTLLVFLMYFCYRCCQRDVEKKQRVPCLRWTMAIFAFLTMAAIGVGFYGNEEMRKGVNQFTSAVQDAQHTVDNIQYQMTQLETNINGTTDAGLLTLKDIYDHHFDIDLINSSMKNELDKLVSRSSSYASAILRETKRVQEKTEQVRFDVLITETKTYDPYRWLSTFVYMAWMTLLCLVLLIGIGRSSKCTLLTFCAFGIFTLVICWMAAGLHAGVGVGAGDLCVDPQRYIKSLQNVEFEKDVLDYYMNCGLTSENPFKNALQSASDSLRQANHTISKAVTLADSLDVDRQSTQQYINQVKMGLDSASAVLLTVTALADCHNLHKDYTHAVKGICSVALPGLALVLLSCVVTGLFFTLLVILASRAWRHFSRSVYVERQEPQPKGYDTVEEDDPFLPRTDNTTYYSFTRSGRPPPGRGAAAEHTGSIQRRPTPPPAYNSYDYREEMTPPPHAGASAPLASHEHYNTFGRDSHA